MIQNSKVVDKNQSTLIQIFGYYPLQKSSIQQPSQFTINHFLRNSLKANSNNQYIPINVQSNGEVIAVIDYFHRAWLISYSFETPICISQMIGKKVLRMTLLEKQAIVYCSDESYLVIWGSKKLLDEPLIEKIVLKNGIKGSHYFQGYRIKVGATSNNYYCSNWHKGIGSLWVIDESGRLKNNDVEYLLGAGKKIKGISIAKEHMFCWDDDGQLYGWGFKSVALGIYCCLGESEINRPTEIKVNYKIKKAYAGESYSLALTDCGKIYEWGKKFSKTGTSLVIEPTLIDLQFKIVDFKAKCNNYCALTSCGQLLLWGTKCQTIISCFQNLTESPTVIKLDNFVVDFDIQESFMIMITSKQPIFSTQPHRQFWQNKKQSVRHYLRAGKPSKNKYPDSNEADTVECDQSKNTIQMAMIALKSKRRYIQRSRLQNQSLVDLLNPMKRTNTVADYFDRHCQFSTSPVKQPFFRMFGKAKLEELTNRNSEEGFDSKLRRQLTDARMVIEKSTVALPKKSFRTQVSRGIDKKGKSNYEQKLRLVLCRKQDNDYLLMNETMKKVENRSFEYQQQKKKQKMHIHERQLQVGLIKIYLEQTLIKHYLVNLILCPLAHARQIKIDMFARNLKLQRLERNIRALFVRTRIKLQLKALRNTKFQRFLALVLTFQKYLKRFRAQRQARLRKIAVSEIMKGMVLSKIKMGTAACLFNVKKLQKFREWLVLVKSERKKCLKYVWKVHLLSMMRINPDCQSSAIFYQPKNAELLTFEAVYQEKVILNPLLKLANFLNKHSIFKIKASYFQKIVTLFTLEQKGEKSYKMIQGMSKNRRGKIKFMQEDEREQRLNLNQTDILPYSVHYSLLNKPKNYDMSLPQIMRVSDRWIREQRKILDFFIQMIIREHEVEIVRLYRRYDADLALYIKRRYDSLSEKRWKYIIEYNQTQRNRYKVNREKELCRLMSMIGMSSMINEDCLPQKYLILDEAVKRSDAPIPPNPFIIFGPAQFRKRFRVYYQMLCTKSKQLRRLY